VGILNEDGTLRSGVSAAETLAALAGLRVDHRAGSQAALVEALVIRVAADEAGLRIAPPWPAFPRDAARAREVWRTVQGAQRGAETLSRARSAADVARGLGDVLGSLLGAEQLLGRVA
jgi:hypothetical protein